jgi:hypothetical protein
MIKNEPLRCPTAKLEAFISPLQFYLDDVLSQLPKEERELAEHLRELSNGNLASSEDNIVAWLNGLEASIQSSNCNSRYYSALGYPLV